MKPLSYAAFGGAALAAIVGQVMASTEGATLIGTLVAAWLVCLGVILLDPRKGIALTSFGAAAANGYLFSLKWAAEDSVSLCSVNEVINCEVINSSQYSEMFGIPITLFGMAFFIGLGLVALFKRESAPHLYTVSALFMIPALIYSAFLGYQSKVIGAFCMFCISIYVANLWVLIGAIIGMKREELSFDLGKAAGSRSMGIVVVVFVLANLVGYSMWSAKQDSGATSVVTRAVQAEEDISTSTYATMYQDASGTIELDGTEPVYGDPTARYTVVEWADFGCPHCAHAATEFKALIGANPNIKLHFRAFPLSGECNPALQPGGGTDRCRAAMAAECANQQDKFWDYSSKLFKNQRFLDDTSLRFQAEQAELDLAAFDACMSDPATAEAVLADASAGNTANVQGTPAIFLLGVRDEPIQINGRVEYIEALIDAVESGRRLPSIPPTH